MWCSIKEFKVILIGLLYDLVSDIVKLFVDECLFGGKLIVCVFGGYKIVV